MLRRRIIRLLSLGSIGLMLSISHSVQVYSESVHFAVEIVEGIHAITADKKIVIVEGFHAITADEKWEVVGVCSNQPNLKIKIVKGIYAITADKKIEIVEGFHAVTADKKVCVTNPNSLDEETLEKLKLR